MLVKSQDSDQKLNINWLITLLSWIIALVATVGSLFFSEVMNFPPCVLCWYQRMAMYPLVLIFLVALILSERSYIKYILPQIFLGWGISLYHNLLYYKWIPESLAPCKRGISCTSFHIEWFGFITIPLLSFTAFSLLAILMIFQMRFKDVQF